MIALFMRMIIHSFIHKFADNVALIGPLSSNDVNFRGEINNFYDWSLDKLIDAPIHYR